MAAQATAMVRVISELGPVNTGINGAGLDGTTTGSWIGTRGANQVAWIFTFTRDAGDDLNFYFEKSNDEGTTIARVQASAISAGTETLSDHVVTKAVTASTKFDYRLKVDADWLRIVFTASTNGTASDLITATAQVQVTPA
jgi:hypothetical protein